TFAMVAFSRYVAGSKFNLPLLGGTAATLLAVLFVPIGHSPLLIEPKLRTAAAAYLLAYTVALVAGQLLKRQSIAAYVIIGVVGLELIHFNRISVGERKFVTKTELRSRTGYNDETVEAIRDIKAQDSSFFFRVIKPRPAVITRMVSLNDALVFDYYGTSSYSSFNHANYTAFLTAVGEIEQDSEIHTRWALGTLNNPLLSTFVGEKYALVDDPAFLERTLSYRFVRQYGPNYLYVNELFMPLGVAFSRYISDEDFLQLSAAQRADVLFRGVVLTAADVHGLQPLGDARGFADVGVIAEARAHGLQLTAFEQSMIEGSIQLPEKSIVIVQTPFDRGWRASANGQPVPVVKADVGLLGVVLPPGDHRVRLQYRNPWLLPGAALSGVALLLVAFANFRWPRLAV
ncbi:MAG TPA: YfhO family protein, partial [Chthoniobacterales bacterium]